MNITLQIKGKDIPLTVKEARALYDQLREVFQESVVWQMPPTLPVFFQPAPLFPAFCPPNFDPPYRVTGQSN